MRPALGSTLGIDNWPARWLAKSMALEKVDWNTFRRNSVLMEGIQTRPEQFARWYERVNGIAPCYFEDSRFGSPEGREVAGVFATATSLRMAYHADTIARNWPTVESVTILDIGGGYGGMALALSRRYAISRYFILDAEPCELMQRNFATGAGLIPTERFFQSPLDLVVNTNSLGEMDPGNVDGYFGIVERHLVDGGAFYTMNRLERATNFERYPYGQGWRHVLVRHPFGNKAWVECLSVRDRGANSEHPLSVLAPGEKRC